MILREVERDSERFHEKFARQKMREEIRRQKDELNYFLYLILQYPARSRWYFYPCFSDDAGEYCIAQLRSRLTVWRTKISPQAYLSLPPYPTCCPPALPYLV